MSGTPSSQSTNKPPLISPATALRINADNAYMRIAREMGAVVTDKDAAYGKSWLKSAEFLKIIFPDGIQPEQYVEVGLLLRCFDKMMRIGNGNHNAFGEDAWRDLVGYSILGASNHEEK